VTLAIAGSALVSTRVNSVRTGTGRLQTVQTLIRGITKLMSAKRSHNVRVVSAKVVILDVADDACPRDRIVRRATMTTRAHAILANAFIIYVDLDTAKGKSVQTMITVIQVFLAKGGTNGRLIAAMPGHAGIKYPAGTVPTFKNVTHVPVTKTGTSTVKMTGLCSLATSALVITNVKAETAHCAGGVQNGTVKETASRRWVVRDVSALAYFNPYQYIATVKAKTVHCAFGVQK
jgi:hypothetical protein